MWISNNIDILCIWCKIKDKSLTVSLDGLVFHALDLSVFEAWQLGSAFRTILACTKVGCTTIYGPTPVRRFLTYPSFSYVTTILIVSDATLGDALRGCWHALFVTIQVLVPSIPSLWLIGPAKFTNELVALAMAINAFVKYKKYNIFLFENYDMKVDHSNIL